MGTSCSKICQSIDPSADDNSGSAVGKNRSTSYYQQSHLSDGHDHQMNLLMKRSMEMYSNQTSFVEEDKHSHAPTNNRSHKKKIQQESTESGNGQFHLLFKQQQKNTVGNNQQVRIVNQPLSVFDKENAGERRNNFFRDAPTNNDQLIRISTANRPHQVSNTHPTRLVLQRHPVRSLEEGIGGTHIYAVRWPAGKPLAAGHEGSDEDDGNERRHLVIQQEQCPRYRNDRNSTNASASSSLSISGSRTQLLPHDTSNNRTINASTSRKVASPAVLSLAADIDDPTSTTALVDHLFQPSAMCAPPKQKVRDWVTVSSEHNVYVADVGLSPAECDRIVAVTEQVCRGQYAAYTYAKQTLGCREFPELAEMVQEAVHTITHAILEFSVTSSANGTYNSKSNALALDDREPHMVKYDGTKKERQKLDMHTDKSEWTFLMSLSNGSGLDYSGGGTYFECLDATVHIQRGHALIFPGKLRHCGQRITAGLRFLLVGFLVDKSPSPISNPTMISRHLITKCDAPVSEPSYIANVP